MKELQKGIASAGKSWKPWSHESSIHNMRGSSLASALTIEREKRERITDLQMSGTIVIILCTNVVPFDSEPKIGTNRRNEMDRDYIIHGGIRRDIMHNPVLSRTSVKGKCVSLSETKLLLRKSCRVINSKGVKSSFHSVLPTLKLFITRL